MAQGLRPFSKNEIILSRHDAWLVYKFFWPTLAVDEGQIDDEGLALAQGLLVEAIDASYAMGFVEATFKGFYGKIPGSSADLLKTVRSFAKKASQHWFKYAKARDLANVQIYQTVRNQIAVNYKSMVALRYMGA